MTNPPCMVHKFNRFSMFILYIKAKDISVKLRMSYIMTSDMSIYCLNILSDMCLNNLT